MQSKSRCACAAALTAVAFALSARAADIFVDVASTAETPNGTEAAPFKTIKAGVDAANEAGGNLTVHVRGYANPTDEQTYKIDSAEDLIEVTASNIRIQAWDWTDTAFLGEPTYFKPLVQVSADLDSVKTDPDVMTFATGADDCILRGLKFKYSTFSTSTVSGGKPAGSIVCIGGNDCVVEECDFEGNGETRKDSRFVTVKAGMKKGNTENNTWMDEVSDGCPLIVRECSFKLCKEGYGALTINNYAQLLNNKFEDCGHPFSVRKRAYNGSFISNRVVNCSSLFNNTGGDGELSGTVEVAYNIFVSSSAPDGFISKWSAFKNGTPSIHHNTAVGSMTFIRSNNINSDHSRWTPNIFNNLFIPASGGAVLGEMASNVPSGYATSFNANSTFNNNAYPAGTTFMAESLTNLSGGQTTAKEKVDGANEVGYYDKAVADVFEKDEPIAAKNHLFQNVPTFISEDINSPDFYRVDATLNSWALDAATGDFIGAQEPTVSEKPVIEVVSFSAESNPVSFGEDAVFTLNFVLHNYPDDAVVKIDWEFGDGETILDSSACTVTHRYAQAGAYVPNVTIRVGDDSVSAELSPNTLHVRLMDVYVKSDANEGGNGTESAPVRTLAEALSLCGSRAVVHVHGGTYTISTAADLVAISEPNVTIQAWEGTGTPTVAIDDGLFANVGGGGVVCDNDCGRRQ